MTYLWKMKASEMSGDRQTAANDQQDCGFHWSLLRVFEIAMFFSALHFSSAETANSCAKSQFLIEHADGSTSCEDCGGQGLSHECGASISADAMVTCTACPAGVSFSSSYDTSSCTPCAPPCLEDQVVLHKCTPTENVRCAKQCYSKDRYYDSRQEGCLACSKCCGQDVDVIEDECKQKVGVSSSMICSFSSANQCATTAVSTPVTTTTINPTSSTTSSVTSVLSIITKGSHLPSLRKDSVPVPILIVGIIGLLPVIACGLACLLRSRQPCSFPNGVKVAGRSEHKPLSIVVFMGSTSNETMDDTAQMPFSGVRERKEVKSKMDGLEVERSGSREPLLNKESVASKGLGQNHLMLLFFALLFLSSVEDVNSCLKTQFKVVHADGSTSCEDCEKCPPGLGLSHECGTSISADAMVTCTACPAGVSFSSSYDTSSCTPCALPCLEDQVVLQKCTPTENGRCAKQCYSKDRYYDRMYVECQTCSKCCGGDGDVVEDECKKKLGSASNMICSFHGSINRCDITTTAAPVQHTTTVVHQTALQNPTYSSITPSDITIWPTFVTPDDQKTSQPSERRDLLLDPSKGKDSSRSEEAGSLAAAGVFWLIACFVTFFLCKRKRIRSSSRCKGDIEKGSHHLEAEALVPIRSQDGMDKKSIKSDELELEDQVQKGSNDPLLGKQDATQKSEVICECQIERSTGKDSKLLGSLLEHENTLHRICVVLDTSAPGRGDYKAVAQYYGFDHYEIKSILEKYDGGPSRALIEALATSHTRLTVEEFAVVVEKETKRRDVPELLRKYDSTVKENEACELSEVCL